MMQDNRLLPLSSSETLDRPLRDLAQPAPLVATVSSQEPAHLREYLNVVLKRKWLILSLMVVVTSLVAIQMYRLPSQYEAQTIIEIEEKSRSGVIAGLRRLVTREKAQPTPQADAGGVPVVSDSELSAEQLTPEQEQKLEPYEDTLRDGLTIDPVEHTNL